MTINNIIVEVLPVSGCAKCLGQTITFQQQETTESRSRIQAAWASFYRYKQELTSKSYSSQHRLRLFNTVISPTLGCASGTWILTKEHERMIRSTQRKMLRLIVQTRRKYKKTTQNSKEGKEPENGKQPKNEKGDDGEEKESNTSSEDETKEGSSSNTDYDQDSDVSIANDSDKEIDRAEIEQEDWVEYVKEECS